MAKLYILSEKDIQNGTRPKTPRQKLKIWRIVCSVLSLALIAENIYFWYQGMF